MGVTRPISLFQRMIIPPEYPVIVTEAQSQFILNNLQKERVLVGLALVSTRQKMEGDTLLIKSLT